MVSMVGDDFFPWSQGEVPKAAQEDYWKMSFEYWLMFAQLVGISAGVIGLLVPWRRLAKAQPVEYSAVATVVPEDMPAGPMDVEATAHAAQTPIRKRLYYLDALKTSLMMLVIMQHTGEVFGDGYDKAVINLYACKDVYANLGSMTKEEAIGSCSTMKGHYTFPMFQMWFSALNETYFMELFFFVSGIFTPSSFDRKGFQGFLVDKFKRLGIPVVAWYFFLGPFFTFGIVNTVFGISWNYGSNGTWCIMGAPWFIAWLLTFNVAYAFVDGAAVKMDFPNIGTVLIAGSIMGVVIIATRGSALFNVPNGISEIIPCAFAFSCGILAKRNGWLEQLETMPKHSIWFLRTLVLLYAGCQALYLSLEQMSAANGTTFEGHGDQLVIFQGMMLLIIPIVLINFFRRFLNGGGRLTTVLSGATFLVYIIHPYVVTPAAWSFVALIRASGAVVVRAELSPQAFHAAYPVAFAVQSGNDAFLWSGWFYTLLVSNAVVWPLAHFLRQLPGLREIF